MNSANIPSAGAVNAGSVKNEASVNPSGPNMVNPDVTAANAAVAPGLTTDLLANTLIVCTSLGNLPLSDVLRYVVLHVSPYHIRYRLDDVGISNLFADTIKGLARYVVECRGWYYYNGICWKHDDESVVELCKGFSRAVSQYVAANSSFISEGEQKIIKKLVNLKSRENIIKDARSVYPLHVSDFDQKMKLFNVLNGTLNLDTGILQPHNPEDLITKVAGVAYEPSAICDRWIQHLNEVTEGDTELAEYIQKAFGLALDGHNKYECFYILYGPKTRNGKSTTMETIIAVMGDYAKSANPNTIAQKQFPTSSGPSEDIARLAGVRLVNFAEPDRAMTLSASVVKTLAGNDTIIARRLYQCSFEFRPQFLAFINTNYLPNVTDRSLFESDRVKVIPFKVDRRKPRFQMAVDEWFTRPNQEKNI